ncbi:MAG TPA: hypothetical protein VH853_16950 [Polyangia bacterium]|jgi:hypothetical protein|nr:hypothetical protein [Polyangia bacterium]
MGRLLKPTSLNRYLSADADPVNLWDPRGSQETLEYAGSLQEGLRVLDYGSLSLVVAVQYAAETQAAYFGADERADILAQTASFYKDAALAALAGTGGTAIGAGVFALGLTDTCAFALGSGGYSPTCVTHNPIPPLF